MGFITTNGVIKQIIVLIILTNFIEVLAIEGCSSIVIYSKAFIDKNPSWEMHEECGYEGCYPLVDVLKGKGINIRIEAYNTSSNEDFFTISLDFIVNEENSFWIDPSKIHINEVLFAKPINCGIAVEDMEKARRQDFNISEYLRAALPITGDIPIADRYADGKVHKCFILFFDTSPPPVEEEFNLYIEGLKKDGNDVILPIINFKPSKRRGGFG